jgi:hypothetical protein
MVQIIHIYKIQRNLPFTLEQSVDIAGLGINVDIKVARGSGQSGDGLNVGSEGVAIAMLA